MNIKTTLGDLKPVPKVAAQTTQGTMTGLVTWLLVTGFWKNGLPPDVATALPAVVGIVWGFVAGWMKKENIVIPPLPASNVTKEIS